MLACHSHSSETFFSDALSDFFSAVEVLLVLNQSDVRSMLLIDSEFSCDSLSVKQS